MQRNLTHYAGVNQNSSGHLILSMNENDAIENELLRHLSALECALKLIFYASLTLAWIA